MLDWNDVRVFLALHRGGSLIRAAALLELDPTTVGRRITALEERMGARMFDRTPDGFALSAAGHGLVVHAEKMESEALALERALAGADHKLSGTVTVTATEMLGTRFIAPHLHRFAIRHPEIVLALVCTNSSVSLARREADIALRLSRPDEPDVVAKRLAKIELGLYASPKYFATMGTPSDPDKSLAGHRAVLFADTRAFASENRWFEARLDGAHVALRSDSVSSVFSAAVGGLGIALLPRAVADAEPLLQRIETGSSPEPRVIWQGVHKDLIRSARVSAVRDFLTRLLHEEVGSKGPLPTR